LAVFVTGNLTGAVCGVIAGFAFGTSEDSRKKTDLMAENPGKNPPPTLPTEENK